MFWDKVKPAAVEPRPVKIELSSSGDLRIEWDDGRTSAIAPRQLRAECPCAGCVEEWTGKRLVVLKDVDEQVRVKELATVGTYALQIHWTDGHSTGLYSFGQLRRYLLQAPHELGKS